MNDTIRQQIINALASKPLNSTELSHALNGIVVPPLNEEQLRAIKALVAEGVVEVDDHRFVLKFTPGPLEARKAINSDDYVILDTASGYIIGRALESVIHSGVTMHFPAKANARLWAAAPDLLRALEWAMTYVNAARERETAIPGRLADQFSEHEAHAMDAITKARFG